MDSAAKGVSVVTPTGRKDPRFREMADALVVSIERARRDIPWLQVEWIIVDMQLWYVKGRRDEVTDAVRGRFPTLHVEPKPCRWQGPHRFTKRDRWAKANALNTGFVYANLTHVACFDDCTVVAEDWLISHWRAAEVRAAAAGPYRYLKSGAVVEAGRVIQGEVTSDDHRLHSKPNGGPCSGGWLYGGNFSVPLDAVLRCNGLDEMMDGSAGLDDCEFGLRVGRVVPCLWFPQAGIYQLSETHEPIDEVLSGAAAEARNEKPSDRCKGFAYLDQQGTVHWMTWNHAPVWRLLGERPERSADGYWHRVYEPAYETDKTRITALGNPFTLEHLRQIRLSGKPLPVPDQPTHDWRDGQPLAEM